MWRRHFRRVLLPLFAVAALGRELSSQAARAMLGGPDSHENPTETPRTHLLGDWHGKRKSLASRGVTLDLQYVADFLWNVQSDKPARGAAWDRIRGTIDIAFDSLTGSKGLYFHATGLWQEGFNLGAYLGLLTGPSGMASQNTFRLDSWWIEKRWLDQRLVARLGQFAGQDFYGTQHYAASFIFEPMGYALGNLFNTIEVFDPPSTSAAELRVIPLKHLYVKSMVLAGDPEPFTHNKTGFVPQFRGHAVSLAELGFTPGATATSVRAFDNVESRRGYSGLYRLGTAYNPGQFSQPGELTPRDGNYLVYGMANQAIWRKDSSQSKGVDATISYDWSPRSVNRNYEQLTAGLRFNEPLPVSFHNTMALGYVDNALSPAFLPPDMTRWNRERAIEFNVLLQILPMFLVQPVFQRFVNAGGGTQHASVIGFRTKVDF
jgi:carbohydrate-selective porin OprB